MLIVIVIALPGQARSQPSPDMDTALTIAIHPAVSTILQLPEEIVDTWLEDTGEIRVARVGNEIGVRPRAETPAGVEALLVVETRSMQRTFRLRVVARARDAHRDVLVLPAGERDAAPSIADDSSVILEEPAPPAAPEPAASASTNEPGPELVPERVEPAAEREVAADMERDTASDAGRDNVEASSPPLVLGLHVVGGLGLTGLDVAGYDPDTAVQPHYALGLRLTGVRPGAAWALEANVGGEWPTGPMLYQRKESMLAVSGPRLRLETGLRAIFGTQWKVSAYAGAGFQMHLRRAQVMPDEPESTLERGLVLTLGVGLQYQTRSKVLLGLDFLVRQGWPDDYYSGGAFLTVGCFLEQGDRP